MTTHQDVLGLVHPGGQTRRSPVVGMEFLHQGPVRTGDVIRRRILSKSQNFIGFILGHRAGETPPAPPVRVTLVCPTPSGRPAVEIRFE